MDFRAASAIFDAYEASALNRTIHPRDVMYETGASHYWTVGTNAVQAVLSGLTLSWANDVNRVLDLPCGHGRVARHLRAAFPRSEMFFCDIDAEGADFCAAQFGGTAVHSQPDLTAVALPRDLDLIWVGSLFTHVDQARAEAWLRYLVGHLRPHGIIAATFHGLSFPAIFGTTGESVGASYARVHEKFLESGYGYERYSGPDDYGLSMSHPATVVRMATAIPQTRMLSYVERGWAYNHDVLVLAKQDRLEPFPIGNDVSAAEPEPVAEPPVPAIPEAVSKRVIVHIGVHKTGSTAIQSLLARNADRLSALGYYYAPTEPDRFPTHNPLAAAFSEDAPRGKGEAGLAALIAAAAGRTVIISAEVLCEPGTDVERFMAGLEGRDVEVVAYVRHPADIVVSAFNESVRSDRRRWTKPVNTEPLAYDPSQLAPLRRWLERKDVRMVLAPYDHAQWPGGSIFADFLETLGIPEAGLDMTDVRVNQSLPFAAAEKLREFNASNPTNEQRSAYLAQLRQTKMSEDRIYPLTRDTGAMCLRQMKAALPTLRPFLREGFREDYLLEPRAWLPRNGVRGMIDWAADRTDRARRAMGLVRRR